MKQLTASQQNLATMELSSPQRPMARENMYQSVPSELNKVIHMHETYYWCGEVGMLDLNKSKF